VSIHASERLIVDGLTVAFDGGRRRVVRDVSFAVEPGEAVGIVGESGSGKSLTLRAILGLLPPGARLEGSITLGDRELTRLRAREMEALRGSTVAMVFQDPMTALNPVLRVGDAIAQVVSSPERVGRLAARRAAIELMERVGISDAAARSRAYPHQFSGGMRQRIVIAMALAGRPTLLLADEPTTALDVIVQAEILRLLDRLRREEGMSLLLVSHDFAVVSGLCERVGVMYAGELVEHGLARDVLSRSLHPYTIGLLKSLPEASDGGRLPSIPGSPPEPGELESGCGFSPRCWMAIDECRAAPIPFLEVMPGRLSRCIRVDHLDELRVALAAEVSGG
jgi:peptide/nickel transport system ATP-binding protein